MHTVVLLLKIKTPSGTTQSITRSRGIIQGCPISVIAFEQAIDPWLRCIDKEYKTTTTPCPVAGYVDDVSMTTSSEEELRVMTQKTHDFMMCSGIQVKHRKCALLNGQRSGNGWYARSKTDKIILEIQGQNIPVYQRHEPYKYLGYEIRIDNICNQVNNLIESFKDTLLKIDHSLLPTCAKLDSINTMCMSSISFYFPNMIFLEKHLDLLEDEIVSYVRHWLGLNKSSTRSFMFIPRSKGGLGIINPRISYYSKHLGFILTVLNSDDSAVKNCARSSLALHFSKRKAVLDNSSDDNFAGYVINEKKLVKQSKVNWPKSNWIHILEMCQRENISLSYSETSETYKLNIYVDEDTSFSFTNNKIFQKVYKSIKLGNLENTFTTRPRRARDEGGDRPSLHWNHIDQHKNHE